MSSLDPSAHKRIGRCVRNFDYAVWDRVLDDAVLAGIFSKGLTESDHELSPPEHWHQNLADDSPFDRVWGIGFRADDPEARNPRRWSWKILIGKVFSTVRDIFCTSEARLATQASSQQFCTPTSTGRIHEISLAPPRPRALARACPGPPSDCSTCFAYAPADSSPEVLAVTPRVAPCLALPEHGPCLVHGIITLDDASFTTKIAVHSGANALAPYGSWRSLTMVPHKLSSDPTYWIACSQWERHPSRASGNALLVPGVVLANLLLCKRRRVSA